MRWISQATLKTCGINSSKPVTTPILTPPHKPPQWYSVVWILAGCRTQHHIKATPHRLNLAVGCCFWKWSKKFLSKLCLFLDFYRWNKFWFFSIFTRQTTWSRQTSMFKSRKPRHFMIKQFNTSLWKQNIKPQKLMQQSSSAVKAIFSFCNWPYTAFLIWLEKRNRISILNCHPILSQSIQ